MVHSDDTDKQLSTNSNKHCTDHCAGKLKSIISIPTSCFLAIMYILINVLYKTRKAGEPAVLGPLPKKWGAWPSLLPPPMPMQKWPLRISVIRRNLNSDAVLVFCGKVFAIFKLCTAQNKHSRFSARGRLECCWMGGSRSEK